MAELRGSKQHSRPVAEGDSPALDGAETGGFDKVIELQATSSGRAAAAHRHAHASPHAHGPQHLTKRWQERSARGWAELRGLPWRLWTPRARGLVLLNLVSKQADPWRGRNCTGKGTVRVRCRRAAGQCTSLHHTTEPFQPPLPGCRSC